MPFITSCGRRQLLGKVAPFLRATGCARQPSAHATCFSDLQQDESLVQETRLVFSHPPAEGFQVSPTIPTFLTAVRSTWQPF